MEEKKENQELILSDNKIGPFGIAIRLRKPVKEETDENS